MSKTVRRSGPVPGRVGLSLAAVLAAAAVTVGACAPAGSGSPTPGSGGGGQGTVSAPADVAWSPPDAKFDQSAVIDVRTPQEFAEGHLAGAVNIDLQSPDFKQQIAALPRDRSYLVYCRSGNRSGVAVLQMKALGFADVTDGGGVQEASNLSGLPVE